MCPIPVTKGKKDTPVYASATTASLATRQKTNMLASGAIGRVTVKITIGLGVYIARSHSNDHDDRVLKRRQTQLPFVRIT